MTLRKFSKNYVDKRDDVLREKDVEALKKRLRKIKKNAIENLDELKRRTVSSLEGFGVVVHETKDTKEAREVLRDLAPEGTVVVKSKSNAFKELEYKALAGKLSWELTETDMGDFVGALLGEGREHPVLPALGISVEEVCESAEKKLGLEFKERTAQEVVETLSKHIRKKILKAEIGITGANAITATGQIVLLENEGNISLVSRVPEKHIVVAGIEKIVPTLEDALHVVRCASYWGTGQELATYVNIISGPSKTADIENELVYGAQGAKDVHLILLDEWRSHFRGTELEPYLYCINCGACYNTCPVFVSTLNLVETLEPESCYTCLTCGACALNCPAKIDWQTLLKGARARFAGEGKAPEEHTEMMENVRKYGNPFGEMEEGEIPDKLYCC